MFQSILRLSCCLVASALPAQIFSLGGNCSQLTGLLITGIPAAGNTITANNMPGALLNLILVGFSDPMMRFPSCGCVQHAAADIVYGVFHTGYTTIPLPPGSTGLTFYLQGVKFYWTQAGVQAVVSCTEMAPNVYFGLTPGYRIVIQ